MYALSYSNGKRHRVASIRARRKQLTHSKTWHKAHKASGWRRYPDTCQAIFDNIPREWGDRYTAAQLGEIAALLKVVYDKGTAHGWTEAEEAQA